VPVQVLARQTHAEAIQRNGGLWVVRDGTRELAPVTAEWQSDRIRMAGWLILLTKSQDSERALMAVEHVRTRVHTALAFQNGVEKDRALSAWCGADRVLGATTMVGGELLEPGTVHQFRSGWAYVGELPSGSSERSRRLAELLTGAGLKTRSIDNVLSAEWSKLAEAVGAFSITALTRLAYHEALLSQPLARLYWLLARETAAVARASGVELDDWPDIFPVRSLCSGTEEQAVDLVSAVGRRLESEGLTEIRPSMLQSAERRQPLEVESIHGFVYREARRMRINAPAIDVCYRLLSGLSERNSAGGPLPGLGMFKGR
jgi:2-dehydropantoate 2-reductase